MESLLLFLMQGIPEMMGTIGIALALARVPLRWKVIIVAAIVLTLSIYLVRVLQLTFGIHTVMAALILTFFIIKATRTKAVNSFAASFASFTFLLALERMTHQLLLFFTGIAPEAFIANELLWRGYGLIHAIMLIFTALIIAKYRKARLDAWKI